MTCMDDDRCFECRIYGDDYSYDADMHCLVRNCDDCLYVKEDEEDAELD